MIAFLAVQLALVAAAAASQSSFLSSGSAVSIQPTLYSFSQHYSSPYTYVTYYSHHKEYVYTYETCSSPPSSIDVCLSSIFSTIETDISSIETELKKYESSISAGFHHEHTLLSSEISWVTKVSNVAHQAKTAADSEYENLNEQIENLEGEKQNIKELVSGLQEKLEAILGQQNAVVDALHNVHNEISQVENQKWSVYSAISAIVAEQAVVKREEAMVGSVIEKLNIQISAVASRIQQMEKRQSWLESWEVELSEQLQIFQVNIASFRRMESNLMEREVVLGNQQANMLSQAQNLQRLLGVLYRERMQVSRYHGEIYGYEHELSSLEAYIEEEAYAFISAYEDFTCENSLLYYEACSVSTTVSSVSVSVSPSVSISVAVPAVSVSVSPSVSVSVPSVSVSVPSSSVSVPSSSVSVPSPSVSVPSSSVKSFLSESLVV